MSSYVRAFFTASIDILGSYYHSYNVFPLSFDTRENYIIVGELNRNNGFTRLGFSPYSSVIVLKYLKHHSDVECDIHVQSRKLAVI